MTAISYNKKEIKNILIEEAKKPSSFFEKVKAAVHPFLEFLGSLRPPEFFNLQRLSQIFSTRPSGAKEIARNQKEHFDKDSLSIHPKQLAFIIRKLGYKSNQAGVCFGFAHMGLQALLLNDLSSFDLRLKKLSSLIKTHGDNNPHLYQILSQDANLLPFFEGIELYFHAHNYSHLFEEGKAPLCQKDNSEAVSSLLLPNKQEISVIDQFSGVYTIDELTRYFTCLEKIYQSNKSVAFALRGNSHAITLGYDLEARSWLLIDSEQMFKRKIINKAQLAKTVFRTLSTSQTSHLVMMENIVHVFKESAPLISNRLTKLKNNRNFKEIHQVTAEKAGYQQVIQSRVFNWLIHALWLKEISTIQSLLAAGADVNGSILGGSSPLSVATDEGDLEIVKVLLKAGANPNFVLSNGGTPLYLSIKNRDLGITTILLRAGANPDFVLPNGFSLLSFAAQEGDLGIVQTLKNFLKIRLS